MPLVLMCGFPSSGKSLRAEKLRTYLSSAHGKAVEVVSEESVAKCGGSNPDAVEKFDRNAIFSAEAKEKELRGQLRSETQRKLNRDTVVILDALNYIKGFRYELYCLSKASKTTCCVVYCDIAQEEAWRFNQTPSPAGAVRSSVYDRDVFDALCMRFEPPDSRNRWDSPLFTLQTDDPLPNDDVYAALFERKAPPAHQSTQSQPLLSTNFLYDLDRITQELVVVVLDAQKINTVGDQIQLLGYPTKLTLTHNFTPMELARLKRQFIVYAKMHPVEDCQRLGSMFIQYLNGGILQ